MAKKKSLNDQSSLFEDLDESETHEQNVEALLNCERPEAFEFKLTLALKPTSGNTNPTTLPVAAGCCFGDRIEEILGKQFRSAYFRNRLRAVVGEPMEGTDLEDNI